MLVEQRPQRRDDSVSDGHQDFFKNYVHAFPWHSRIVERYKSADLCLHVHFSAGAIGNAEWCCVVSAQTSADHGELSLCLDGDGNVIQSGCEPDNQIGGSMLVLVRDA